jgi:hypothetical protein
MGMRINLSDKEEAVLGTLLDIGPVWNEYIPDRNSRESLISAGLAVKVVCRGNEHYVAATPKGAELYMLKHGVSSLIDAIAKHKTKKLMAKLLS